MTDINISLLKDKVLDVDPDLRFMALEDFKKYLNEVKSSTSNKAVEGFIPLLFRLLRDTNANVQSQAVKSFGLILRHISSEATLKIIGQLYEEMLKENEIYNDYKITTSLPSMAMKSIFNSNYSFSPKLSRDIITIFTPRIVNDKMSVDSIDLLIDIIKNVGYSLNATELLNLLEKTNDIAFDESGIISKRSVAAFSLLLIYLDNEALSSQILNKLVEEILLKDTKANYKGDIINLKLTLFSSILQSLIKSKKHETCILNDKSVGVLYEFALNNLKLEELEDEIDVDEYDIDLRIQENLVKEECLNTIINLVNSIPYSSFEGYIDQTLEIIEKFLRYDPLNFETSDSLNGSDGSDIEFSDEEGFDNDEDENDYSWKVRVKGLAITRSLVERFNQTLPLIYSRIVPLLVECLTDRNDVVSNECVKSFVSIIDITAKIKNSKASKKLNQHESKRSDVSMMNENDPLNLLVNNVSPVLEDKILTELLVPKKAERVTIFLKLVESLIIANDRCSPKFLERVLLSTNELGLRITNVEYLNFFKTIISSDRITSIPAEIILKFFIDLAHILESDTFYSNIITDLLGVVTIFLSKVGNFNNYTSISSGLVTLFDSIAPIATSRNYSPDIRQKAVSVIVGFHIHTKLDPSRLEKAIGVYEQSLNSEATVKNTVDSLVPLFNVSESHQNESPVFISFIKHLISKVESFISSSDDVLYLKSLELLNSLANYSVAHAFEGRDCTKLLLTVIVHCEQAGDYQQIQLLFEIAGKLIPYCNVDKQFTSHIIRIINTKLEDVDGFNASSFEKMIEALSYAYSDKDLKEMLFDGLDLRLFTSAKTLSVVVVKQNLDSEITKAEKALNDYIYNGVEIPKNKLIFNIHFLGCITLYQSKPHLDLKSLLKLLENDDESVRLASSRSIGILISKDPSSDLNLLLENFEMNETQRSLNLISLKHVLGNKSTAGSLLEMIWDKVWTIISSYSDTKANVPELRLSGDVLSKICLIDNWYIQETNNMADSAEKEPVIYTIIVILKQLVNHYRDNDIMLRGLLFDCLDFLWRESIEIKQVLVGTILTCIHNRPSLLLACMKDKVLPLIYNELSAKDAFKKVIPMGPYKYVIDDGLEVRKLSYELLYTVIGLDPELIRQHRISFGDIGSQIISKGLSDSQPDIVILSCITLINLVNKDISFLTTSDSTLEQLIDALRNNLNKKLKSKASTQESESYHESLKAVIKLSKTIDNTMAANNVVSSSWNSYYMEMKSSYFSLYNSVLLE
ncbi:Piso0_002671 [Millerozyma farinosa CBS 7064]|uniref:Piso0_002671 protein n=1 Tax=Pichia sorbitophila (strain ATCC MYA-4447 / BCRC 22081 / CBS 7064 / NBRC 10061 / NRRL Y-12695) TaxID=559304 RepID=G8YD79_PICSO|nr:Piso0_002671 [Millerozyma farinosa CBS 7064]